MKKLIFSLAICMVSVLAYGQSSSVIIDNQTGETVYFHLYGDAGSCSAASATGMLSIAPYSTATYMPTAVSGLSISDFLTMVSVYSYHPAPPPGPCTAGVIAAYVSECYAQGYGPGPVNFSLSSPMPPVCALTGVNVRWDSNTPMAGVSTVVIW